MRRWLIGCLLMACALPGVSFADAPGMLPVQGFLSDDAGAAVNDVFAVTFKLYADEAGTVELWTEDASVNFVDGYFTAYLGSVSSLDLALFRDNGTIYLGVSVGDDEEMTPFALGSSPFAGFAQYAGFAGDITDAAKVQIVGDVAVQLDNDGKVHDKYTDAEAIAAVTDALANDATQLEAALGATDNSNTLNHARYTDDEARSALNGHTSDAAAHHTRYADSEAQAVADARITTHTADVDAHHAKYTDAEAVSAVSAGNLTLSGNLTVSGGRIVAAGSTFNPRRMSISRGGGTVYTFVDADGVTHTLDIGAGTTDIIGTETHMAFDAVGGPGPGGGVMYLNIDASPSGACFWASNDDEDGNFNRWHGTYTNGDRAGLFSSAHRRSFFFGHSGSAHPFNTSYESYVIICL